MREPFVLWATPRTLPVLVEKLQAPHLLQLVQPALEEYLNKACLPLLDVPIAERNALHRYVVRYAIAGQEPRLRVLLGLLAALDLNHLKVLDLALLLKGLIRDFRDRASHLFGATYIDCFEMGTRVYFTALDRLIRTIRGGGQLPLVAPERASVWYELLHWANCLDLTVTSILWYLEESPDPARSDIPEELCFLTKEYGLAYSARLSMLVETKAARGSREAVMADADARWDRDFCSLTLPDLAKESSSA